MKKLLLLAFLLIPVAVRAQLWTGILDSSRAIDWSVSPALFTIPSGSWSQCATAACNTLTSAGTGATAAQINSALASANNSYVQLATGTYSLADCIKYANDGAELRGNGPRNTIIKFTASSSCNPGSGNSNIGMLPGTNIFDSAARAQPGGTNAATLTGTTSCGGCGLNLYPQGATQITLTSIGSDTPIVGQLLFIDQVNDSNPFTDWMVCTSTVNGTPPCGGTGSSNGRGAGGANQRNQIQIVTIAACNGSSVPGTSCGAGTTYTISPGLYAPNIRSSQNPGVWWNDVAANSNHPTLKNVGLRNLTIDSWADASTLNGGILIYDVSNWWIVNVRNTPGGKSAHVLSNLSAVGVIRDSYFQGAGSNSSGGGYGVEFQEVCDVLIENNIWQEVPSPTTFDNACGIIWGYSYNFQNLFVNPNYLQGLTFVSHDAGGHRDLIEGNDATSLGQDSQHAGSNGMTYYRNRSSGQQPAPSDKTNISGSTIAYGVEQYIHDNNIIANVLGMIKCVGGTYAGRPADLDSQCIGGGTATGASYSAHYEASPNTGTTGCGDAMYVMGFTSYCAGGENNTRTSSMRWANYDTVNAANQFNSAEVPTTGSNFVNGNPVPTTTCTAGINCPASFYRSSKPSWYTSAYGSPAWPPIGPEVTGGDLKGYGGRAYRIPARLCADNVGIDPAYQTTYTITNAVFSSTSGFGGVPGETLTVSPTPSGSGLLQVAATIKISGTNTAGLNQGFLINSASSNTLVVAVPSDPGWTSGGTFTYPNILNFDAPTCYPASASTPSAPSQKFFTLNVLPLPAQPPVVTLTSNSPLNTYLSAQGFSQDGKTFNASLNVTATGTGFTSGTACTLDGTAIPCSCGSSTLCTVIIPASALTVPAVKTPHQIGIGNTAVVVPALQ